MTRLQLYPLEAGHLAARAPRGAWVPGRERPPSGGRRTRGCPPPGTGPPPAGGGAGGPRRSRLGPPAASGRGGAPPGGGIAPRSAPLARSPGARPRLRANPPGVRKVGRSEGWLANKRTFCISATCFKRWVAMHTCRSSRIDRAYVGMRPPVRRRYEARRTMKDAPPVTAAGRPLGWVPMVSGSEPV